MGECSKILIVDNRASVRLFLSAIIRSIGMDLPQTAVSRMSQAREEIRCGNVRLLILGLEKYEPVRKMTFLQYLFSVSPQTAAVLVYDAERSVKIPNGSWITEAWPKAPYYSSLLDRERCRTVFERALNLPISARKIEKAR